MTAKTKKGYELAGKLLPLIGWTNQIVETCSLICRHAATLHQLAIDDCNGYPLKDSARMSVEAFEKLYEGWRWRIDENKERLNKTLTDLVGRLPEPEWNAVRGKFVFSGVSDPRGRSVIIVRDCDYHGGDSWGDGTEIVIP